MIEHVPVCQGCGKLPEELDEYIVAAASELEEGNWVTDDEVREYVRREEGTFNPTNSHFLCTSCYINAGMPTSPRGWICP